MEHGLAQIKTWLPSMVRSFSSNSTNKNTTGTGTAAISDRAGGALARWSSAAHCAGGGQDSCCSFHWDGRGSGGQGSRAVLLANPDSRANWWCILRITPTGMPKGSPSSTTRRKTTMASTWGWSTDCGEMRSALPAGGGSKQVGRVMCARRSPQKRGRLREGLGA